MDESVPGLQIAHPVLLLLLTVFSCHCCGILSNILPACPNHVCHRHSTATLRSTSSEALKSDSQPEACLSKAHADNLNTQFKRRQREPEALSFVIGIASACVSRERERERERDLHRFVLEETPDFSLHATSDKKTMVHERTRHGMIIRAAAVNI